MPVDQKKRLDISVETRKLEIELFWRRSLFFWGFITAAFGGYAVLRNAHSDLSVVVACFGLVCSFAWTLVNRGSKYWQESWETKVERSESGVIGNVFKREEDVQLKKGPWLRARRYSVSKLSIALSDFVFGLWAAVVLFEMLRRALSPQDLAFLKPGVIGAICVISFMYLLVLENEGKSTPRDD